MAKIFYDDIIISEVISTEDNVKTNKVIMIEKNVELQKSIEIVNVLKKVLSPRYYIMHLGPNQYEVGSTYHSKR